MGLLTSALMTILHSPTRERKAAQSGADWTALAAPSHADSLTVYDPSAHALRLRGNDRVARGGGGAVYAFRRNPDFLIKICKDGLWKDFSGRLDAMLALEECRNAAFLAWPVMPVFNLKHEAVGFVMRKCSGRTLRALYAPFQVKRFFPGWDKRHLARTALNLVNGVRFLARQGVLINDFNPDNFLVNPDGCVQFIDCDSFQIPGPDGGPHLSKTFMPEFAAPELLFHPESFRSGRTPEQIRFSLAVVVYMILLSGLHPFARCGGSDPVANLKSGCCPLNPASGGRLPVGWVKSVSWLPDSLKQYFVRMFAAGYADPMKRPMIGELKLELEHYLEILRKTRSENQRAILPATQRKSFK